MGLNSTNEGMMRAEFTVMGNPKGKGRPRFTNRDGYTRTYTPSETVSYENLVALEFERQCGKVFFEKDIPLRMVITAYLPIPSSVSKKKRAQMVNGELYPLKKADSSNILKAVEDALNGVAYHDDVQFVDSRVLRYYGEVPRVEVMIEDISGVK